MSDASSDLAPEGEGRSAAHGATLALLAYVLWYDIGTIEFGLAEPTTHALVLPAVGVGAVFWFAEKVSWVPRGVVNLGVLAIPILVAALIIGGTA